MSAVISRWKMNEKKKCKTETRKRVTNAKKYFNKTADA